MLSGEATNTNFLVFGLAWSGLRPLIYRTQCEHANHYPTDQGSDPLSTALSASTLTITPLMRLLSFWWKVKQQQFINQLHIFTDNNKYSYLNFHKISISCSDISDSGSRLIISSTIACSLAWTCGVSCNVYKYLDIGDKVVTIMW